MAIRNTSQDEHIRYEFNAWMHYRQSLFAIEDRDTEAIERGFEFLEGDHPVNPNDEPDRYL